MKYKCNSCGNNQEAEEAPECCGATMEVCEDGTCETAAAPAEEAPAEEVAEVEAKEEEVAVHIEEGGLNRQDVSL